MMTDVSVFIFLAIIHQICRVCLIAQNNCNQMSVTMSGAGPITTRPVPGLTAKAKDGQCQMTATDDDGLFVM